MVTNKTAAVQFQRFANHRRESPRHRTILYFFPCEVTNRTGTGRRLYITSAHAQPGAVQLF